MAQRIFYREGAPDEAIELFDGTSLPGMVRFAEVELCVQVLGGNGMRGKFQPIVDGDGLHP